MAALIACLPIQLSILAVFLFAGPHNFIEFRYLLSRLPKYYSRIRMFFILSFAGTIILSCIYIGLSLNSTPMWQGGSSSASLMPSIKVWNFALIAWVVALFYLRTRETPRRSCYAILPSAGIALFVNAMAPQLFSLGLVYLHPLVAFWILDREIRRMKPQWLKEYHQFLSMLPLLLCVFWLVLFGKSDLPVWDSLTKQILAHVGSFVVVDVSTHLLVATHTFFELMHYAVWLLLIPLVTKIGNPLRVDRIPLTVGSSRWKTVVPLILLSGVLLVAALFVCFSLDFETTRYIYFSFAILHVLAEIPLLIRLL